MASERDKMLAGELYSASDPSLEEDRRACRLTLEWFNASSVAEPERRRDALVELLAEIGADTIVEPPLHCDYGYNFTIGARCYINTGVVALDCAAIRIGDDVQIGPRVQLLAATHPVQPDVRRTGLEYAKPITIEDGVWLGGGVIVCPGVTIGADSVIGAGSVVLEDIPPQVVAVGSPCRVVRRL
ncbi:MAG TPA: sugar O-acetyltransferase [Coriobacteriia bacterium]|nr:sugar O-acetyltransferase [Coriobacteriia bacterium]